MTKLGPYEVHPFADSFPLIEGDEFAELVADIRKNGLADPLTLNHDGTVLVDGRNRYRACEAAGADPSFTRLPAAFSETQILDLIVSKNLARRQLNAGQRALMALEYERYYAAAAKPGRPIGGAPPQVAESDKTPADLREFPPAPERIPDRKQREASAQAARVVGASGRAVQQAKAVQRDTPDLADKVRAGSLALDAADKERKRRMASLPKPEPVEKPGPVMLTLRTHTGEAVEYPKPQAKPTFHESTSDGISWAAWSWNPVTGCLHGCDYCYARGIATNDRFKAGYPAGFTPLFHEQRLDAPADTSIPAQHRDDPAYKRVFVCSMADLYGRWVPDEWIDKVHASMLANPQWEYLTLTKFPGRYVGLDMPPNAWVGTSVDEQKRVRIAEDAFRKIDGVKVKWLSLEPLKEPLEFTDLSMFDWVVIGAQTGTQQPGGYVPAFAPPIEWVMDLVDQAREAGCKVHLKPNLANGNPGMKLPDEYPV